jgi:hypothetical protein
VAGDLGDFPEREPEPASLRHEVEQGQHVGTVDAIARRGTVRARQNATRECIPISLSSDLRTSPSIVSALTRNVEGGTRNSSCRPPVSAHVAGATACCGELSEEATTTCVRPARLMLYRWPRCAKASPQSVAAAKASVGPTALSGA